MRGKVIDQRDDISLMVEGTPKPSRQSDTERESLKTGTMPRVRDVDTIRPQTSETGVNRAVSLVEGDDRARRDATDKTEDSNFNPVSEQVYHMKSENGKVKVLIVEDTVELAEILQATLENIGLKAIFETHGMAGLERMKETHPDVILLDIGLPDITGWKMLDGIKEYTESRGGSMPAIIVISAYGDPANRLIGKLQNIHSYLIKPFTPDEVERLVQMALRGERPSGFQDDEVQSSS